MKEKRDNTKTEKCRNCRGSGEVTNRNIIGFTEPLYGFGSSPIAPGEPIYGNETRNKCPDCRGVGFQRKNIPCPLCEKTRKVSKSKQAGFDIGSHIGLSNNRFGGGSIYRTKNFQCPLCFGIKKISRQNKRKLMDTYKRNQNKRKSKKLSFKEYLENRYIR